MSIASPPLPPQEAAAPPRVAPGPVAPPAVPAPAPPLTAADCDAAPFPLGAVRTVSLVSVAVLLVLEVLAALNHYAMRVSADTPTFMTLIRDLAVHPLRPDSVFFGTADTRSLHASPYLQILAYIWRAVAPAGGLSDPYALGTFVGLVGIPVTVFVLAMLWLYTRSLAGPRAAWISLPALLVVLGPAHIIFSSDLSLNGFLDTGYYPTTLATGLTLAVLLALERDGWLSGMLAVGLTAFTLTTDLLSGAVLVVLMVLTACLRSPQEPVRAIRVAIVLAWAVMLAAAWPVFDLPKAFAASGLPVGALVAVGLLAPALTLALARRVPRRGPLGAWQIIPRLLATPVPARLEHRVARFGARAGIALTIYVIWAMGHWPADQPVLASYRLGFYWNDQRDRWLLLLLPAAAGLIGLWRLAARRRPLPLLWLAAFLAAGAAGAAVHLATGRQLPFYYRFILIVQVPVAVGVAAFLAHHRSRRAAWITVATLAAVFAYKATTLIVVPDTINYFGSPLQTAWSLGRVIPPGPGLVASDPATSYYIPLATGHKVLTLSPGHADSGRELVRAQEGYWLLRRVYAGTPAQAAWALREMWRRGVRWVVVEKFTSFAPGDVKTLFAAPYNALITGGDANLQAQYNTRLTMAGRQVADSSEYSVYRLDASTLAANTVPSSALPSPSQRALAARILRWVANEPTAGARLAAPHLARLGVRTVTLTMGTLGAEPRLTAYGASIADPPIAAVPIDWGRWVTSCVLWCRHLPDTSTMWGLGSVVHQDPRFSTVVRLP